MVTQLGDITYFSRFCLAAPIRLFLMCDIFSDRKDGCSFGEDVKNSVTYKKDQPENYKVIIDQLNIHSHKTDMPYNSMNYANMTFYMFFFFLYPISTFHKMVKFVK